MRELVKDFVKRCFLYLPTLEPIYEFGARQVEGQEGFADLRPLFQGLKFIGTDMEEGVGVDELQNLHNLTLANESVGTALVIETLEHVEYPREALDEIYRVLKPGGVVVLTTTMACPIHNHPSDFWRFTPAGLVSLLGDFPVRVVVWAGMPDFPFSLGCVGVKGGVKEEIDYKALEANLWEWSDVWTAEGGVKR